MGEVSEDLVPSKGAVMAILNVVNHANVMAAQRWDAEFFDPKDLKLIERLESEGGQQLRTVCGVLNGKTPTGYVEEGGIPVVRSGDLVHPFIYRELYT
jgi:hypothetical protein